MSYEDEKFSEKVAAFYDRLDEVKTAQTIAGKMRAIAASQYFLEEIQDLTRTDDNVRAFGMATESLALTEIETARQVWTLWAEESREKYDLEIELQTEDALCLLNAGINQLHAIEKFLRGGAPFLALKASDVAFSILQLVELRVVYRIAPRGTKTKIETLARQLARLDMLAQRDCANALDAIKRGEKKKSLAGELDEVWRKFLE